MIKKLTINLHNAVPLHNSGSFFKLNHYLTKICKNTFPSLSYVIFYGFLNTLTIRIRNCQQSQADSEEHNYFGSTAPWAQKSVMWIRMGYKFSVADPEWFCSGSGWFLRVPDPAPDPDPTIFFHIWNSKKIPNTKS